MINKVTLIGNLGKDPEIRHLESGTMVGKFSLATNESYKDKNDEWQTVTEWHDVVVWRGLAQRVERDLKKGSLCFVEGKLTHRKYQDKDGNTRYLTEIVANTVRLLEKRESQGGFTTSFPETEGPKTTNQGITESTKVEDSGNDLQAEDDDLPF